MSIKINEELKKVDFISGTNINSNKELQKSPITEIEISNSENKESNTDGFLNQKRSGLISNKEKENCKKGKVDNKEKIDNQRRELFHKCLDSIYKTVSNLIDNIIENRDKIFTPVIN